MILEVTQLSAAPKPASEPVSGWIQPIVIALVLPEPAPLIPEPQACSSPPVPRAAAPTPAARSSPRRLMPLMLLAGMIREGAGLPDGKVWSLISHRSPCEAVSRRPGTALTATGPRQVTGHLLASGALYCPGTCRGPVAVSAV